MKLKKLLKVIGIFVLLIVLGVSATVLALSSTKAADGILFAAHRGYSGSYPENTLPAFEEAVKAGFYAFECDVQTTKDGKWVVIHNQTIDAMTNGEGNVNSYTYEELQEFSIDNGNGIENFENLKIPLLDDVLSVCDTSEIIPIIEVKGGEIEQLSALYEIIVSHSLQSRCVIISFDFEYLTEMKNIDKDISCMYIVKDLTKEAVDMCINNGDIGLDFNCYKNIFNTAVKYAKDNNLELGVWTVDWNFLANYFYANKVALVTTNKLIY